MPVCDLSPRTQGSVRCYYIDRTAAGGRRGYESDRTQTDPAPATPETGVATYATGVRGHTASRTRCGSSDPSSTQRPIGARRHGGWLNRPVPLSPVSLGWLFRVSRSLAAESESRPAQSRSISSRARSRRAAALSAAAPVKSPTASRFWASWSRSSAARSRSLATLALAAAAASRRSARSITSWTSASRSLPADSSSGDRASSVS